MNQNNPQNIFDKILKIGATTCLERERSKIKVQVPHEALVISSRAPHQDHFPGHLLAGESDFRCYRSPDN